jgi:hypothetical protein
MGNPEILHHFWQAPYAEAKKIFNEVSGEKIKTRHSEGVDER